MSAWVHGDDHIDLIVSIAVLAEATIGTTAPEGFRAASVKLGEVTGPTTGSYRDVVYSTIAPTDLGRTLLAENVASVRHRYDDIDETPEGVEYDLAVAGYEFQAVDPVAEFGENWIAACLRALDSYDYQSCEHPGWAGSDAQRWTEACRGWLIHSLPGYGAARTHDFTRTPVSHG